MIEQVGYFEQGRVVLLDEFVNFDQLERIHSDLEKIVVPLQPDALE